MGVGSQVTEYAKLEPGILFPTPDARHLFQISDVINSLPHRANVSGGLGVIEAACSKCVRELLVRESSDEFTHPARVFNRDAFERLRVFAFVMELHLAAFHAVNEDLVCKRLGVPFRASRGAAETRN